MKSLLFFFLFTFFDLLMLALRCSALIRQHKNLNRASVYFFSQRVDPKTIEPRIKSILEEGIEEGQEKPVQDELGREAFNLVKEYIEKDRKKLMLENKRLQDYYDHEMAREERTSKFSLFLLFG